MANRGTAGSQRQVASSSPPVLVDAGSLRVIDKPIDDVQFVFEEYLPTAALTTLSTDGNLIPLLEQG